jgi:hypothetical protein
MKLAFYGNRGQIKLSGIAQNAIIMLGWVCLGGSRELAEGKEEAFNESVIIMVEDNKHDLNFSSLKYVISFDSPTSLYLCFSFLFTHFIL